MCEHATMRFVEQSNVWILSLIHISISQAAGDKKGIVRYGSKILPMDEALILCALDLCGRPYLVYDLNLEREFTGDLETEMVKEFFYAVSYGAAMNLHIKQLSGQNCHHIIEGAFKAFGKALDLSLIHI